MARKKVLSDAFQERLIGDLSELKTEVRLGNAKIEAMDIRINGRLKKLEKTVFGDEETKTIGLAEAARVEHREIKSLNRKWMAAIAAVVFFVQYAAQWVAKKMGLSENVPVIEAAEAAGLGQVSNHIH